MDPEKVIVCKCERVSLKQVREAISSGVTDIELIKRMLRVGMGPCQGLYCLQLVAREIALATGRRVDEIKIPPNRPPVTPIPFSYFTKPLRVD